MFDTSPTALTERMAASTRRENMAAADRLVAVGELFAARLRESGEDEDWALDTTAAVAAEVAAALHISQGLAESHLRYARAMRERIPKVGAAFAAGDIDFRAFQAAVCRTELIRDRKILDDVDGQLAVGLPRWTTLSRKKRLDRIDAIVIAADRDAARRRPGDVEDRELWINDRHDGLSEISGTVLTPHAHAVGKRLAQLAATVCPADPRTPEARRADAMGAWAVGADRLTCQCGLADCPAATKDVPPSPVVIHLVADRETVETGQGAPATIVGMEGLIPPEMVAELATSATLLPIVHPHDAPPEPGYHPSKALADFVRHRDLTCRFPGCDRPATHTDIDHTIPYPAGPTQASNLKCLCRTHHLVKTFGAWRDQQLRDGTVVWTSPAGEIYVTSPGSALLFPSLCAPTAAVTPSAETAYDRCGERTAMMPRRRRTRAQNRAARVAAERKRNRLTRAGGAVTRPVTTPRVPEYYEPPPF